MKFNSYLINAKFLIKVTKLKMFKFLLFIISSKEYWVFWDSIGHHVLNSVIAYVHTYCTV